MATIQLPIDNAAVVSVTLPNKNYSVEAQYNSLDGDPPGKRLVCGISSFPDSLKYRNVTDVYFVCYFYNRDYSLSQSIKYYYLYTLDKAFDKQTVVFYDLPPAASNSFASQTTGIFPPCWERDLFYSFNGTTGVGNWSLTKQAVRFGFFSDFIPFAVGTYKDQNAPYFEIVYSDHNVGVDVTPTYPTGNATISTKADAIFTWDATVDDRKIHTFEPVEAVSAVLRWKYAGSSEYLEVHCDKPTQHVFPADTFVEGSIEWQVEITANSGVVTASEWMTTEIKEPVSSAVALSPMNVIVDGSTAQTFAWEHIISNGTAQYAFDLQTSPDASTWTTIRHAVTPKTMTEFAAGTFAAGDLWWRVRTYNLVGTAGTWSDPVRCIVLAAPATPPITADDTSPRFVLRWQQTGQQAYELKVDGVVIAKTFSAESIYRHNGYLEPGTHRVQVRIQNKYQMWSEWGAANLQIENVAGEAIQLSAEGDNEVALSWITAGSYDSFIVYRNGVKIAETVSSSYVDHFAIGETLYQVRGVYADSGYYTLSDTATVAISPKTLLIADVSNPVWIKLPLSTSSLRSAGLSASQSVTYTHYIGSGLPGAEIGEAVQKIYDIDCAFKATDLENIRQFEALLGKIVCLKTPSQRRIIGVMSQMSAKENFFYVAYSAPITEVRWEEMQA